MKEFIAKTQTYEPPRIPHRKTPRPLPELREHEINIEHVMKALSVLGVSEDGWGFGLSIDGGFMHKIIGFSGGRPAATQH